MNLFYETETELCAHRECRLIVAKEDMGWNEKTVSRCKLIIEWINKALSDSMKLYSTSKDKPK